jgi:hypothetical protein
MFSLFVIVPSSFAVTIDGVISSGEYSKQAEFDKGNFKLSWEFEGDKVFMAIIAKTPGWISVGFNPSSFMSNSDLVLAVVKDNQDIKVYDEWSSGMFGPHVQDTEKQGTFDILSYAGSRSADMVIFEFSRLLDTKDKYDKVIITSGKFKIMWAYGPSLDMTAKHKKAGTATVEMAK